MSLSGLLCKTCDIGKKLRNMEVFIILAYCTLFISYGLPDMFISCCGTFDLTLIGIACSFYRVGGACSFHISSAVFVFHDNCVACVFDIQYWYVFISFRL